MAEALIPIAAISSLDVVWGKVLPPIGDWYFRSWSCAAYVAAGLGMHAGGASSVAAGIVGFAAVVAGGLAVWRKQVGDRLEYAGAESVTIATVAVPLALSAGVGVAAGFASSSLL